MSKDITQSDKPQEGFSQNPLQQIMKNTKYSPKNQNVNHIRKNDATPPFYINHFFGLLVGLGLLGGLLALIVPTLITWPITDTSSTPGKVDEIRQKSISDLRLHILYITGGIIAVLTLLQTNWKNQIDRRKVEDDIEKNKNDHRRQVHAERRNRYTAAVGQLGDEKVAVRLGGVYTLVGLVDEWLTDESLSKEIRQKEGQVIINNLCAYIRSPFPLAEMRDFFEEESTDQDAEEIESIEYAEDFADQRAKFQAEQDVRRTIFVEMSNHLSKFDETTEEKIPGPWSSFSFNFSKAPIFYPLNGLTFEDVSFMEAKFYGEAKFNDTCFAGDADFVNTHFTGSADFTKAKFKERAYFPYAHFENSTYFFKAAFERGSLFDEAHFEENVSFFGVVFMGVTHFEKTKFTGSAYFSQAHFAGPTIFSDAVFNNEAPTFYLSGEDYRFAAYFSYQINPENYIFRASPDSPYEIELGEAELYGKKFILPADTMLFDPNSWDDDEQRYTRGSIPAK